jgi:DNA-directed RNA polymerase subunit RPC12/RpoP
VRAGSLPKNSMTNTCPDCGASMELEQHEVRLRTGVCPACAKEFAFVEGTAVSSRLAAPAASSGGGDEAEEKGTERVEGGPECDECGSPLQFREGEHGSLEVVCPECETTTVYVPKPERPPPSRGESPRFEDQPRRGRPCRRCGAELRFSTGEDGLVVGECESCGNRFTLPPRPGGDRGGPRYRGGPSYGRTGFRRGPGGRPPYPGRGRAREGRPFGRPRRRESPDYEDDGDRRRKRRRSSDE